MRRAEWVPAILVPWLCCDTVPCPNAAESLTAYDYYLRGMAKLFRWTKEDVSDALRLFYMAIELDSDFSSAYAMAAWCYVRRKGLGWMSDRTQETAEAIRLAWRAVRSGREDGLSPLYGPELQKHTTKFSATALQQSPHLPPQA
jgi:hypothetical protein